MDEPFGRATARLPAVLIRCPRVGPASRARSGWWLCRGGWSAGLRASRRAARQLERRCRRGRGARLILNSFCVGTLHAPVIRDTEGAPNWGPLCRPGSQERCAGPCGPRDTRQSAGGAAGLSGRLKAAHAVCDTARSAQPRLGPERVKADGRPPAGDRPPIIAMSVAAHALWFSFLRSAMLRPVPSPALCLPVHLPARRRWGRRPGASPRVGWPTRPARPALRLPRSR